MGQRFVSDRFFQRNRQTWGSLDWGKVWNGGGGIVEDFLILDRTENKKLGFFDVS